MSEDRKLEEKEVLAALVSIVDGMKQILSSVSSVAASFDSFKSTFSTMLAGAMLMTGASAYCAAMDSRESKSSLLGAGDADSVAGMMLRQLMLQEFSDYPPQIRERLAEIAVEGLHTALRELSKAFRQHREEVAS